MSTRNVALIFRFRLVVAIALFAAGGAGALAQGPQTSNTEIERVTALSAFVDGALGPPSPKPTKRIGGVELGQLEWASLQWMRDLLLQLHSPQPELINYIADRMIQERTSTGDAWRDGAAFTRNFVSAAQRAGVAMPQDFSMAVESARNAERELAGLRVSSGVPGNEARERAAAADLPGKRRAVTGRIRNVLAAAGALDAQTNPRWKALYTFLTADLDSTIQQAARAAAGDNTVLGEMRDAFWRSSPRPEDIEAAYSRAAALDSKLSRAETGLIYSAFRPGQTPMGFLRNELADYLATQRAYDQEVVRAAEILQSRSERVLTFMFSAVINLQDSLGRRLVSLRGNPDVAALDVLIDMADAYHSARVFARDQAGDGYLRTPRFDRSASEAVVAKARRIRENWQKGGMQKEYALVAVDTAGQRVWSLGNWLTWKWLDADEHDDLKNDGRTVTLDGREWVVPPGTDTKNVRAISDLRARGQLEELVVALERSTK